MDRQRAPHAVLGRAEAGAGAGSRRAPTHSRPSQAKELSDAFEKVAADLTPPKPLMRPRSEPPPAAVSSSAADPEQDVAAPVDPFDVCDEKDVLGHLPADFESRLASTMWKERLEALEELLMLVSVPKLASGAYNDLVGLLVKVSTPIIHSSLRPRQRLSDSNVLVVASAANALAQLTQGLRQGFAPFKQTVLPALLEKLKEKKANVIIGLRLALDNMFLCVSRRCSC